MIFLTLSAGISTEAQTSSSVELQTAYLYNFAKYIKWPVNPETHVIGIFADDETVEFIVKTLKEKK